MIAKLVSFEKIAENTDKLPVLFLASIEQHGPFIPVGTDSIIAEALLAKLEENLGKKLILFPPLPFGCSLEHQGFPGTISVEFSTYMRFIKDIVKSIFEADFKKLLLISTHGGNDLVARLTQAEWNYTNDKKVHYLNIFNKAVDKKSIEIFGGLDHHAGCSESSIIAYIKPEAVAFKGVKKNKEFAPKSEGAFSLYTTKEITPLGILNFSPHLEINPKKGQELFEFMIEYLTQKIEEIA